MAEFEKLQGLWPQHPERCMTLVGAETVTPEPARYGRRQDGMNIAKMAVSVTATGWELSQPGWSTLVLAGLAMATIDWRSQGATSRLNFAAPSAAFARHANGRILEQREPFRKYYRPSRNASK